MRSSSAGEILLAALLLLASAPAFADGVPSHYVVTIEKIELKTEEGRWVTVIQPDKQVDLIESEARVAFFNNGRVPEGRYLNFRITLSDRVKVAGQDHASWIREGGEQVLGMSANVLSEFTGVFGTIRERSPVYTDDKTQAGYSTFEYRPANGSDGEMTLTGRRDFDSMTVHADSFISVLFIFDFSGTVRFTEAGSFTRNTPARDTIVVMPPRQVQEVRVTVDTHTETLKNHDITLSF